MEVKYIHLKDGTVIMFSKYTGLQHAEMLALHERAVDEVADAGFVDFYDGQFEVWGESLSLGVKADGRTNRLLNENMEGLKVYDCSRGRAFASNRDTGHELLGEGLDSLRRFRIL